LFISWCAEHEACAADIAELRWHVSFTRRELGRVKEKVSAAEKLNADLIKDIDFVRKHWYAVSLGDIYKQERNQLKVLWGGKLTATYGFT